MPVTDDGTGTGIFTPAPNQDTPGYPSVKAIPAHDPLRRQAAPARNQQAIPRKVTTPGPRKVQGSTGNQAIIDKAPAFDQIKRLPGYDKLSADEQAQVAATYHETITKNQTWYKQLTPDARDAADAKLLHTDVATLRTGRGDTPKPNYAATPREQIMSGVATSPVGYGYAMVTGKKLAPTYAPNDGMDTMLQTTANVATTLPLMAAGSAAGGLVAGGTAAARLAAGVGAGLTTEVPTAAGKYRLGEITGNEAIKQAITGTMATTAMWPFNAIGQGAGTAGRAAAAVGARNVAQTAIGGIGELAKGNEVTAGSLTTDLLTGLAGDAGDVLSAGARNLPNTVRNYRSRNLDITDVPDAPPPAPLQLPPGRDHGFQQGPVTSETVRADVAPLRTGSQLPGPDAPAGLLDAGPDVPPVPRLNPATGFTRVGVDSKTNADATPIPMGPVPEAPKRTGPLTDAEAAANHQAQIDEAHATVQGTTQQLMAIRARMKAGEITRAKAAAEMAPILRQQTEAAQRRQALIEERENPNFGTRRQGPIDHEGQIAGELRNAREQRDITGDELENTASTVDTFEPDGRKSVMEYKPGWTKMRSDADILETGNRMAYGDEAEAYRAKAGEHVGWRDEVRRLQDPSELEGRRSDERAMNARDAEQQKAARADTAYSGVRPDTGARPMSDADIAASQGRVSLDDGDIPDWAPPEAKAPSYWSKEAAQRRIRERSSRLNAGLDPEALSDHAILAYHWIKEHGGDFPTWAKETRARLGDEIKPHLKEIWKRANDAMLHPLYERIGRLQADLTDTSQRLATTRVRLHDANRVDRKTGILNDFALEEEWKKSKRSGDPSYLAVVDLDTMKEWNTRWGHAGGDALLNEFVKVANQFDVPMRRSNRAGDEFAALFKSREQAEQVLAAMDEALRKRSIKVKNSSTGELELVKGAGFTHGVGEDLPTYREAVDAADRPLEGRKAERISNGLRGDPREGASVLQVRPARSALSSAADSGSRPAAKEGRVAVSGEHPGDAQRIVPGSLEPDTSGGPAESSGNRQQAPLGDESTTDSGPSQLHAGVPITKDNMKAAGLGAAKLAATAPVKAALTLPKVTSAPVKAVMKALGMTYVDAKGETVAKTGKLYDAAVRAAYTETPDTVPFADKIEKVKGAVLRDYGLTDNYLDQRADRGISENRIAKQGMRLFDSYLRDLTPADQELLHRILTDESTPVGLWGNLREDVRTYLDDLGARLAKSEGISLESYERNKGQYLSRAYKEYEAAMPAPSKAMQSVGKKLGVITDQLKGRGIGLRLAESTLSRLPITGKHPKTGNPVVIYDGHEFELVGQDKGKYLIRRDYTAAEREKMGEIQHAGYTFLKTVEQLAKNVSSFEFYKGLAGDSDIARADAGLSDDARADLQAKGWELIGSQFIKGTQTRRWGALEGHWVDKHVARELRELAKMQTPTAWKSMMSLFKKGHTVWSPKTHVYNFFSNFSMLHMLGGDMSQVPDALLARLGHGKTDDWTAAHKLAEEFGVYGNNMDQVRKVRVAELDRALGTIPKNASVLDKVKAVVHAVDQHAMDLYGSEDDVFRLALFKQKLDEGASPKQAALAAKRGFVDYDITAPLINSLRNGPLPFLAWGYGAAPVMIESALKRPWQVAGLYATWQITNALMSWAAGGNEDEERAAMSGQIRSSAAYMRLPFKDDLGQQRYLNTARYVPFGDTVAGAAEAIEERNPKRLGEALSGSFSMGGPAVAAYNAYQNYDPSTEKPIVPRAFEDDAAANWGGRLGYFAEAMTPPIAGVLTAPLRAADIDAPTSYDVDQVMRAAKGQPDRYGRRDDLKSALLNASGFRTRAVVPDDLEERRMNRAEAIIDDAEREISKAQRQRSSGQIATDGELNRTIAAYERVIAKESKARDKYQERLSKARSR